MAKQSKTLTTVDKLIEDPRRALVIGGFIVVAIILLVVFWGRIKGLFTRLMQKVSNSDQMNELYQQTGETPTLGYSSYYTYATQLYNAFNPYTFGLGTDEQAVYSVFRNMNNTADVLRLIDVFGIKDNKSLDSYIRSELSSSELRELNNILASKNIAYSF